MGADTDQFSYNGNGLSASSCAQCCMLDMKPLGAVNDEGEKAAGDLPPGHQAEFLGKSTKRRGTIQLTVALYLTESLWTNEIKAFQEFICMYITSAYFNTGEQKSEEKRL